MMSLSMKNWSSEGGFSSLVMSVVVMGFVFLQITNKEAARVVVTVHQGDIIRFGYTAKFEIDKICL